MTMSSLSLTLTLVAAVLLLTLIDDARAVPCYRVVNGIVPRTGLGNEAEYPEVGVLNYALVTYEDHVRTIDETLTYTVSDYVVAAADEVAVDFAFSDCRGANCAVPSVTLGDASPADGVDSFYTLVVSNRFDANTGTHVLVVDRLEDDNSQTSLNGRVRIVNLQRPRPLSVELRESSLDDPNDAAAEIVVGSWTGANALRHGQTVSNVQFAGENGALRWGNTGAADTFYDHFGFVVGKVYTVFFFGQQDPILQGTPSGQQVHVEIDYRPGVELPGGGPNPPIVDLCVDIVCNAGRVCRNGRCVADPNDDADNELCRSYLGFDYTESAREVLVEVDAWIRTEINETLANLRELRDAVVAYDAAADGNNGTDLQPYTRALRSVCHGRDERCSIDECVLVEAGMESNCTAIECEAIPYDCVPLRELEFLQTVFLGAIAKMQLSSNGAVSDECLHAYDSADMALPLNDAPSLAASGGVALEPTPYQPSPGDEVQPPAPIAPGEFELAGGAAPTYENAPTPPLASISKAAADEAAADEAANTPSTVLSPNVDTPTNANGRLLQCYFAEGDGVDTLQGVWCDAFVLTDNVKRKRASDLSLLAQRARQLSRKRETVAQDIGAEWSTRIRAQNDETTRDERYPRLGRQNAKNLVPLTMSSGTKDAVSVLVLDERNGSIVADFHVNVRNGPDGSKPLDDSTLVAEALSGLWPTREYNNAGVIGITVYRTEALGRPTFQLWALSDEPILYIDKPAYQVFRSTGDGMAREHARFVHMAMEVADWGAVVAASTATDDVDDCAMSLVQVVTHQGVLVDTKEIALFDARMPSVAVNSEANFFLASWLSCSTGSVYVSAFDLYHRLLWRNLVYQPKNGDFAREQAKAAFVTRLGSGSGGGFVIVYTLPPLEGADAPAGDRIYARRINDNGGFADSRHGVFIGYGSHVAVASEGEFTVVTWRTIADDEHRHAVFYQTPLPVPANKNVPRIKDAPEFDAMPFPTPAGECGNSVVEAAEECDEGAGNSNAADAACRMNCRKAHCGDHVVDAGAPRFEACDHGRFNTDSGRIGSCSLECAIVPHVQLVVVRWDETSRLFAGARVVGATLDIFDNDTGAVVASGTTNDDGEFYFDAQQSFSVRVQATIDAGRRTTFVNFDVEAYFDLVHGVSQEEAFVVDVLSLCGNAEADGVEECDQGAAANDERSYRCRTACTIGVCGDGIVDPALGEECDDGEGNFDDNNADDGKGVCTIECKLRGDDFATLPTLSGVVSDATSGDAIEDAVVELRIVSPELIVLATTTTDENGTYTLTLPAANINIETQIYSFRAPGYGVPTTLTLNDDVFGYDARVEVSFALSNSCGDGVVQTLSDEQCDYGTAEHGNGDNQCRDDCTWGECGDGAVDWVRNDEQCDDAGESENCFANCTIKEGRQQFVLVAPLNIVDLADSSSVIGVAPGVEVIVRIAVQGYPTNDAELDAVHLTVIASGVTDSEGNVAMELPFYSPMPYKASFFATPVSGRFFDEVQSSLLSTIPPFDGVSYLNSDNWVRHAQFASRILVVDSRTNEPLPGVDVALFNAQSDVTAQPDGRVVSDQTTDTVGAVNFRWSVFQTPWQTGINATLVDYKPLDLATIGSLIEQSDIADESQSQSEEITVSMTFDYAFFTGSVFDTSFDAVENALVELFLVDEFDPDQDADDQLPDNKRIGSATTDSEGKYMIRVERSAHNRLGRAVLSFSQLPTDRIYEQDINPSVVEVGRDVDDAPPIVAGYTEETDANFAGLVYVGDVSNSTGFPAADVVLTLFGRIFDTDEWQVFDEDVTTDAGAYKVALGASLDRNYKTEIRISNAPIDLNITDGSVVAGPFDRAQGTPLIVELPTIGGGDDDTK